MKEKHKRIVMLVFLAFLIFTVSGKLLTGVDDNTSHNNSDSQSSNPQHTTNNHNYSEERDGIPITTENYKEYYEAKGFCDYVVDGNTIEVSGVGKIRLVGIDAPNKGQPGYQEASDFVKSKCLGKVVYLDIDDAKNKDKYGRILAVVFVDGINLNVELLKRGYAQIMYIPPSEFDPYSWT